jgi:hypothetical protein
VKQVGLVCLEEKLKADHNGCHAKIDRSVDPVKIHHCNRQEKNEKDNIERDDETRPLPFDICPGDFINKDAAIGYHNEEQPFLDGQTGNEVTRHKFPVEPPDIVPREVNIPDDKYCGGNECGWEKSFPMLIKSHFFVEAQEKRTQDGSNKQQRICQLVPIHPLYQTQFHFEITGR